MNTEDIKRRESSSAAFEDLVQLTVKAAMLDKVQIRFMGHNKLVFVIIGHTGQIEVFRNSPLEGLNRAHREVHSTLTETFMLEQPSDMTRVKIGAVLTLSNGEVILVTEVLELTRGWAFRFEEDGITETLIFKAVKGSKVFQEL